MSTLNLNANINGAKRGLPYPTAGLDVIVYNSTYEDGGTTYYRTSKGIGLPVISGTGLDTIIDFSVLLVGGKKDLRFNKNAYVGSSYTDDEGNPLPANYNFPFVGIYYDSANPYYWKITDFHYANILAQSLLVDNMFFLKAKATTNTSNVIASWDRLFIYTTALADNNLAKMKTYIGIQEIFEVNEVLNSYFNLNNEGELPSYWDKAVALSSFTQKSEEGYYTYPSGTQSFRIIQTIIPYKVASKLKFAFDYHDVVNMSYALQRRDASNNFISYINIGGAGAQLDFSGNGAISIDNITYLASGVAYIYVCFGQYAGDASGYLDNVKLSYKYENFYAS